MAVLRFRWVRAWLGGVLIVAIAAETQSASAPPSQAAGSASLFDATPLTLKLKDASPQAALAEIARQSSYQLVAYNEGLWQQAAGRISMAADRQPFWSVLGEFCTKAGVTLNPNDGDRRMQLMPEAGGQNMMRCPVSVHGAFMAVVGSVHRNNMLELGRPQEVRRSMYVSMQVLAEPKLQVIGYAYHAEVDEAVDENGNSLLPPSGNRAAAVQYTGGRRDMMWRAMVPLQYPASNPGQRIVRLRGKVACLVQTGSERLEIDNIMRAQNVTRALAGRRITVKDVRKTNERYIQVSAIFHRDGMEPQQFMQMVSNPPVRLLDGQQREYLYNSINSRSNRGEQYEVTMLFHSRPIAGAPPAGEPAKLVWDITTASQEYKIPFDFADLPLP